MLDFFIIKKIKEEEKKKREQEENQRPSLYIEDFPELPPPDKDEEKQNKTIIIQL